MLAIRCKGQVDEHDELDVFIENLFEFGACIVRPYHRYKVTPVHHCYMPRGSHVVMDDTLHGIYLGQFSGVVYYDQKTGFIDRYHDTDKMTHVIQYQYDNRRQRHDTIRVATMFEALQKHQQQQMQPFMRDVTFCLLCRIGVHDDLQIIEDQIETIV